MPIRPPLQEIVRADRAHIRENVGDDNMRFNLWGRFVLKKLSYPLVWLLLRMRIKANTVTLLGALIAILGCTFLAQGNVLTGAILINVWALLDYTDGQIARWNKTSGNFGRFLDNLCDIGVAGLVFLSLGMGVYHPSTGCVFLLLGAWTAICYLFTLVLSYSFERLIVPQLPDTELTGFVSSMRVKWLPKNLVQVIGFNFQNITGLVMPAILLGAVFGGLRIVLILWAVIGTVGVCFLARSMLNRASRIITGGQGEC